MLKMDRNQSPDEDRERLAPSGSGPMTARTGSIPTNGFDYSITPRKLTQLKVGLVFNPTASNPDAVSITDHVEGELQASGVTVERRPSLRNYESTEHDFPAFLARQHFILVAGGDGTLMGLLPLLQRAKVPVLMIPVGNESLFAGQYGMGRTAEEVVRALESATVIPQYSGLVEGRPFYSMMSIGLDSKVVEVVTRWRLKSGTGKASDRMYKWAGVLQMLTRFFALDPNLSITVDGVKIADQKRGYLIIGNTSSFARNLNLLPNASANNPSLEIGFHPASRVGAIYRELRRAINLGQHKPAPWLAAKLAPITARDNVVIEIHDPFFPVQVDGEYFLTRNIKRGEKLVLTIGERLLVLAPNNYTKS